MLDVQSVAATGPSCSPVGMKEYTKTGVIGFPSRVTAEKGQLVLYSLMTSFTGRLTALGE